VEVIPIEEQSLGGNELRFMDCGAASGYGS